MFSSDERSIFDGERAKICGEWHSVRKSTPGPTGLL